VKYPPKSKPTSVLLGTNLVTAINAFAIKQGWSRSRTIRRLLAAGLSELSDRDFSEAINEVADEFIPDRMIK